MHISMKFSMKRMHAAIVMGISKAVRTDIGAVGRPLYCRILAMGRSIRIGAGHSSSLKYVKNLKRL